MCRGSNYTQIFEEIERDESGKVIAIGGNSRLAEIYAPEIPDWADQVQIDLCVNWSRFPASGNSWSGWNPPEFDEERNIDSVLAIGPGAQHKELSDIDEANEILDEMVYEAELPYSVYESDGSDCD